MGEKRFTLMLPNAIINDTIVRKSYYLSEKDDVEKLVDKLNEQQDFIYQLQDLCGESDGENAKLRIENKKLKDDLHNCKFNKNIIGEQLKLWQDTLAKYNIYTIKDFEELMKKVK